MDNSTLIIAVGLLAFVLLVVKSLVAKSNSASNDGELLSIDYEYQLQPALVTKAELKFYKALSVVVRDRHLVFSKVRIADVITPSKGQYDKRTWWKAFNQVACKHYDFVLCDPDTLKIDMVIELDDSSHQKANRIKRDTFVDSATKSSGVTLKRFKVQHNYDYLELETEIYGVEEPVYV